MSLGRAFLVVSATLAVVAGRCAPPEPDIPDPDTSLVSESPEIHTGTLGPDDLEVADGSIIDTYAIDPPPGTRVVATLRSSDFAPFLFIATPSGATSADEDPNDGPDARVEVTTDEEGAYMVQVTSQRPGETGAYTLTIERAP